MYYFYILFFAGDTEQISKENILWNSAYRKCTFRELLWRYPEMGRFAEFWRKHSVQYSRFAFNHFATSKNVKHYNFEFYDIIIDAVDRKHISIGSKEIERKYSINDGNTCSLWCGL